MDEEVLERWLEQWHGEKSSAPDKFEDWGGHFQAIWYSEYDPSKTPDELRENSVGATSVELSSDGYVYSDYRHISEWYMDEPWDPDRHDDYFNIQTVQFEPLLIRRVLLEHFRETVGATPQARRQMPKTPLEMARWVSGLGSAYVSYYGGEEDTSESLP